MFVDSMVACSASEEAPAEMCREMPGAAHQARPGVEAVKQLLLHSFDDDIDRAYRSLRR